jgi:hypothetical protein
MHQELRRQVKIHRISEKLNKGIKISIFLHPTPGVWGESKREKSSPSMQGKGKLDLREKGLTIPR